MVHDGCIFCRIALGEVPATIVHDGDGVVAFRDLSPQSPTHVLVIPRRHVESAAALGAEDGDLLREMFAAANEVARTEGIFESGYRLVMNVGDDANNTVPHLHLHVLGGRKFGWPPG
jgi:histidine triad (HIT) family protein